MQRRNESEPTNIPFTQDGPLQKRGLTDNQGWYILEWNLGLHPDGGPMLVTETKREDTVYQCESAGRSST